MVYAMRKDGFLDWWTTLEQKECSFFSFLFSFFFFFFFVPPGGNVELELG